VEGLEPTTAEDVIAAAVELQREVGCGKVERVRVGFVGGSGRREEIEVGARGWERE